MNDDENEMARRLNFDDAIRLSVRWVRKLHEIGFYLCFMFWLLLAMFASCCNVTLDLSKTKAEVTKNKRKKNFLKKYQKSKLKSRRHRHRLHSWAHDQTFPLVFDFPFNSRSFVLSTDERKVILFRFENRKMRKQNDPVEYVQVMHVCLRG